MARCPSIEAVGTYEWPTALIRNNVADSTAAWIYCGCATRAFISSCLNREPIQPLDAYAEAIDTALSNIIIEPGWYLVGDAGLLRTEILLIARESPHEREGWICLDAGLYNGLDETLNEWIHHRIRTPHDGGPSGPVILAGPTCDSTESLPSSPLRITGRKCCSCTLPWLSPDKELCGLTPAFPEAERLIATKFIDATRRSILDDRPFTKLSRNGVAISTNDWASTYFLISNHQS